MARAPHEAAEPLGERFALFAECLLFGVLTALCSLPLVTAPAAFQAACRAVRRYADGGRPTLRSYAGDLAAALRGGVVVAVAAGGAVAFLLADLWLVGRGLPGGRYVAGVALIGLAVVSIVLVRSMALRAELESWRDAVRVGAERTVRDPAGSLLVLVAVLLAVAISWQLVALIPLTPGPLAVAAVAVENRRSRR